MPLMPVILTILVILQSGLIITGGAVRLTGSGLGCPTWPQCTKGSFKPIAHQAQGQLHAWIEFGNRLLTFVLFFVAVAAVIMTIRASINRFDKRRVRLLAIFQLVGILGQGVLGGITVLTHLNPIPVAGHFLLTIALIAGAISLRQRMLNRPAVELSETETVMTKVLLFLTLIVIVLGTVVTGSGPHAGDIQARRFGFDPRTVSWIHADSVIALISLTFGLLLILRISPAGQSKPFFAKAVKIFFLVCIAQGGIGYIQYFTGLPELVVGTHLLGSALVWCSMWNVYVMKSLAKK